MPIVSICLTTYNRATNISKTIDSILQQSFSDFELIINDDNSTDCTAFICQQYSKKDSRVKYYCNDRNLRMPGNLNNAIAKATGEYVANLHDGDVYRPDLIEKWLYLLQKYSDALFVFNQYSILDANNNMVKIIDHDFNEINDGKLLLSYFYKHFSSAPWGTVMARRTVYEQFGLFNSKYEFISDVEMWLRLGMNGRFCYVNEPLIELTPREQNHKYFLPHSRVSYISVLILSKYYQLEKSGFKPTAIVNNIKKELIYSILLLIKHRNIDRIREYLFLVWKSPFWQLKILFIPFLFVNSKKPEWFNLDEWQLACKIKR